MFNETIYDPCHYRCPRCNGNCEKVDLHYDQIYFPNAPDGQCVAEHKCTPCNLLWIQNLNLGPQQPQRPRHIINPNPNAPND